MRIKAIRKKSFSGRVYNLGVQDDESYMANGIAVHNCRCFIVPVTQFEVERKGTPAEDVNLPADFPDPGFQKFVEAASGT